MAVGSELQLSLAETCAEVQQNAERRNHESSHVSAASMPSSGLGSIPRESARQAREPVTPFGGGAQPRRVIMPSLLW